MLLPPIVVHERIGLGTGARVDDSVEAVLSASSLSSVQRSTRAQIPMRVMMRHEEDAHRIAWFGNVQMIFSREAPTPAMMRRIILELDGLAKQCGCATGALLVIDSSCSPPSDEARTYIRTELARSSMRAAAQVVEGTGFRGAAMRAVLSVIQLASRPPYPMSIFSRVDEGVTWLCGELETRVGTAPSRQNLAAAAREVQASWSAPR